jgi:hypothetical protein
MVDFSDIVWGSVVGNWINGAPSRSETADNTARQRAKNIQDNFGVQPKDIGEYRSEHGGSGLLKALAITAAGAAVGGLIALAGVGGVALTVGLLAGAVGGLFSMASQSQKVQQGYSRYLDDVAAKGREMSGKGQNLSQEYSNGAGRTRSYTSDIAAERQMASQLTR